MHLHGPQVVIFPGLAAGDATLQVLLAGRDVALEDAVQRHSVTTQANDLVAHLQGGQQPPSPPLPHASGLGLPALIGLPTPSGHRPLLLAGGNLSGFYPHPPVPLSSLPSEHSAQQPVSVTPDEMRALRLSLPKSASHSGQFPTLEMRKSRSSPSARLSLGSVLSALPAALQLHQHRTPPPPPTPAALQTHTFRKREVSLSRVL